MRNHLVPMIDRILARIAAVLIIVFVAPWVWAWDWLSGRLPIRKVRGLTRDEWGLLPWWVKLAAAIILESWAALQLIVMFPLVMVHIGLQAIIDWWVGEV